MSRRTVGWKRLLGFGAALVVVTAAGLYGPDTLRRVDAFRVQEVEVVGTRFVEPYAVVRAAGLDRRSSVFDDADVWIAGVRALSLVEEVHVRRVYPSKVRLEVREVEPVALVAGRTLRPVDAAGRLLDLHPAGAALDLPVVTGVQVGGRRVAEGASRAATATVALLVRQEPRVAEEVSQIDLQGEQLWLTFRNGSSKAVLPVAATSAQLAQLRLTLSDLKTRGEMEKVRTIDVRFRDQVVVSFLDRP